MRCEDGLSSQVHVRVGGQLAACSGGHAPYSEHLGTDDDDFCRFSYSPTHTPHTLTATPSSAHAGDTVTISGSGFGSDRTNLLVLFGDIPCSVTVATDAVVECVLQSGRAGQKELYLHVAGGDVGVAQPDSGGVVLDYAVAVETVDPSEGSQAGGTLLTISGSGFVSDSGPLEWVMESPKLASAYALVRGNHDDGCAGGWENEVEVGGARCDITGSSHVTITCITPPNPTQGVTDTHDVTVKVRCRDDTQITMATAPGSFSYSTSLTSLVTSVTPVMGSVHGGDSVVVSGNGFPDDIDSVTVEVRAISNEFT